MIQAANTVIAEQKKQIEIRDIRVVQAEAQVQSLTKENADLKLSEDRWWKNPYLWGVVGILAGGFLVKKF